MSIAIDVFLFFVHKINVILPRCKDTLTSEVIFLDKPKYSDNMNGLTDLIDADTSAYEYYVSLPTDIKRRLDALDVTSFEEMQEKVRSFRNSTR